MNDTKQKIVDAAERLFGEQGFAAVSLRQIIAEAGVNLAAIHYHFGSKEELLVELMIRKIGPVNEERLAVLGRFEEQYGPGAVPVEQVLEAFLLPAFVAAGQRPQFVHMMGRLHAEGVVVALFRKHFDSLFTRFRVAFRNALPELPEDELNWRLHFMIGAMAHALTGPPVAVMEPAVPCVVARRLIAFLSGAMRAPVPREATS